MPLLIKCIIYKQHIFGLIGMCALWFLLTSLKQFNV